MIKYKTINFSNYSSFKIGAPLHVALITPQTTQNEFAQLQEHYLIGGCNNILIGDNPPPLMMLDKSYDFIEHTNDTLRVGAATPSGKLASYCKKHNIADFEFISHLPGKMGGLLKMNAGLKEYEICNNLHTLTTTRNTYTKEQLQCNYRTTSINEIILEATFNIQEGYDPKKVDFFKKMRSNQPSTPSAGSCFKNPPNDYAGRLIEAVGLKGLRVEGMEFSTQHANFLVNADNGTYKGAIYLIKEAQKRVFEVFGIKLELEIEILDKEYLKALKA